MDLDKELNKLALTNLENLKEEIYKAASETVKDVKTSEDKENAIFALIAKLSVLSAHHSISFTKEAINIVKNVNQ
ncbi:hypothetical protein WKM37_000052 [Listeria monocytogenes]|uniref:Uncharacterized protein n=1 Tax=Listeria monocytogenes TaxID=1639 RepID=A0A473XMJ6_LISMN|nr:MULTISPECIES: hypothetical protein [Listeria]EAC5129663.1 hypothetical protein [Listeria monocytogenes]EAC9467669.1 hypothetical protein [Listeria monocytogenes]EAD0460501.1 hypothetical protein [Listeria monocytogenes]EAD3672171.1 hypothetical protein [Listeria monocytogenes]EAD6997177.1 hypothetical protein [Listeria monocytogenes]